MPADIVTLEDCASNYGVFKVMSASNPSHYWVVSFGGSEGPAHCTCPSYKYSGEDRHCKHIDRVWKGACMYNPQWCDGHKPVEFNPVEYTYTVKGGGRCPACGGPTVLVRRAV